MAKHSTIRKDAKCTSFGGVNMESSIYLNTPCGSIRGSLRDGVKRFLGIRYATAKRFEYAQEVTKWEGVYDASAFGPAPIQARTYPQYQEPDGHSEKEFLAGEEVTYSEDCLFLNIWAPENAKNCPVLVVIYGGGNMKGHTNEKPLDGTEFAKRGIVVVSMNYRINVFGIMAIPELETPDGRCGNFLYYDQHTAFDFIRHNIASFGGDPENMTLIGQSAGAASCETQIKSPLNKGYFKNAIIQSSAGFATVMKGTENREKLYELWGKVYAETGCTSVEELKTMPAEKLFDAYMRVAAADQLAYANFVYDENFTGHSKNLPCNVNIICGMTSEDVMPLILYVMMRLLAKRQLGNAPVYSYYFSRQLPGDDLGAWHSCDLWYTYGALHKCWRNFTKEDWALSRFMMDYFTNFIRTGDPNGSGLPVWPPYQKGKNRFMCFDVGECSARKPPVGKIIHSTFFKKKKSSGF